MEYIEKKVTMREDGTVWGRVEYSIGKNQTWKEMFKKWEKEVKNKKIVLLQVLELKKRCRDISERESKQLNQKKTQQQIKEIWWGWDPALQRGNIHALPLWLLRPKTLVSTQFPSCLSCSLIAGSHPWTAQVGTWGRLGG